MIVLHPLPGVLHIFTVRYTLKRYVSYAKLQNFATGFWIYIYFFRRKCDVINRGLSGYNSEWAKIILPRVINQENMDTRNIAAVTIFFGANDCALKGSIEFYCASVCVSLSVLVTNYKVTNLELNYGNNRLASIQQRHSIEEQGFKNSFPLDWRRTVG